jgi:hypothetical protein
MKTTKQIALAMGITTLATLTSFAGVGIGVSVQVPVPVVVVPAPAPAVTVVAPVPDSYVWDGTEYVGVVGTQYYYLGPHHVWLTLDAPRVARFNGWQRVHADWRIHAIRNELYRRDAHGHDYPLPDDHGHDIHHDHDH